MGIGKISRLRGSPLGLQKISVNNQSFDIFFHNLHHHLFTDDNSGNPTHNNNSCKTREGTALFLLTTTPKSQLDVVIIQSWEQSTLKLNAMIRNFFGNKCPTWITIYISTSSSLHGRTVLCTPREREHEYTYNTIFIYKVKTFSQSWKLIRISCK